MSTHAEPTSYPSTDLACRGPRRWRLLLVAIAHTSESSGLSASGAVEAQQYQVASVIAGQVTKVEVSEGDVVSKAKRWSFWTSRAEAASVPSGTGVKAARAALSNAKKDAPRPTSHQPEPAESG